MIYFNGIKGNNYFEGWFFRVLTDGFNCSLIPSVSVSNGVKKAFVQFNCNGVSGNIEYDFSAFSANDNEVTIGGNSFSDRGIRFCCAQLELEVEFGNFQTLERDIMGWVKFGTPCRHKIISMKHSVNGCARLRGQRIEIRNGAGYIEKDWGKSFPKSYCWMQCNQFRGADASYFFSAADIGLPFKGLICVLLAGGEEYRFATYDFSRIKQMRKGEIILTKSDLILYISFSQGDAKPLLAPVRGKMDITIKEDLCGTVHLTLVKNGKTVFDSDGVNAGIEWVNL